MIKHFGDNLMVQNIDLPKKLRTEKEIVPLRITSHPTCFDMEIIQIFSGFLPVLSTAFSPDGGSESGGLAAMPPPSGDCVQTVTGCRYQTLLLPHSTNPPVLTTAAQLATQERGTRLRVVQQCWQDTRV